jgi:hypothetical protein
VSSPRMTICPVMKPIVSTDGMVRLIVASADLRREIDGPLELFASAARVAASDSGDRINTPQASHLEPQARERIGQHEIVAVANVLDREKHTV